MNSVYLSPLSGSSSVMTSKICQALRAATECVLCTIARPLLCPPVALCPPKWSEYACSPTEVVVEQSEAVTFGKIMGRLEDRETGVWADERWAPQLQRVTKQPPSLLVSDSLV